jgi:dephospho-CoA kinase
MPHEATGGTPHEVTGETQHVLRIGLTGGLASGKSFVGHALADLGCFLIQADELGHQVMMPGGEAYDGIVREFGNEILNPDGTINRRALAAQVFGNPERLAKLNALVHPPVRAREEALAAAFAGRNPGGIAVSEAAILIETGRHKSYARLIVAVCSEAQQIERAMARDRLTREEALDRMRRQMPLDEKVKYADYVVDTSGSKENTLEQTRQVYQSLRSLKL